MSRLTEYVRGNRREIGVGAAAGLLLFLLSRGHLTGAVPLLLLMAMLLLVLYFRRSGAPAGGGVGVISSAVGTRFCDIGGQDRALSELRESLDLVVGDEEAARLGVRPVRGLLLVGPPGTGKTMMARAAAAYADACFLAVSGSEFVEMYAGVGAQRVREIFSRARRTARRESRSAAIVFIDEMEIVGGKRGRHSSHLEYDQTLNQLLVAMDGMQRDESPRILVMGATNRRDLLDDALLRPGRFDRVVHVDYPDFAGRKQILALHLRAKPLADDVDLDALARETFGFSGAHLENLSNEAAILAFRERRDDIASQHLLEAVEKVMMGDKIDRRPSREQLHRVAVHEVGHALMAELLEPGSVAAISIAPRGGSLGHVRKTTGEDQFLYTGAQLRREISFSLAGCAAEQVLLGESSTGVGGDFSRASGLAERLVFAGMSPAGIVAEETLPQDQLNRLVRDILNRQMEDAVRTVRAYLWVFDLAVPRLLEEERLNGEQLRTLLSPGEMPAG